MTILSKVDPLTRALTPVVRDMLLAEVERAAKAERASKPSKAEMELDAACCEVARAADRHAAAKYTADEIPARRRLEKAATALGRVMRKHGRMPKGE